MCGVWSVVVRTFGSVICSGFFSFPLSCIWFMLLYFVMVGFFGHLLCVYLLIYSFRGKMGRRSNYDRWHLLNFQGLTWYSPYTLWFVLCLQSYQESANLISSLCTYIHGIMLELLDSRIRPGFVAAEVKFARILKDFCNKNTR